MSLAMSRRFLAFRRRFGLPILILSVPLAVFALLLGLARVAQ